MKNKNVINISLKNPGFKGNLKINSVVVGKYGNRLVSPDKVKMLCVEKYYYGNSEVITKKYCNKRILRRRG